MKTFSFIYFNIIHVSCCNITLKQREGIRGRYSSVHFRGGVFLTTQNSKSQVPIFIFGGGGGGRGRGLSRIGYSWQNEPKVLQAQARSCITDSLSQTTCVETKKAKVCFLLHLIQEYKEEQIHIPNITQMVQAMKGSILSPSTQ